VTRPDDEDLRVRFQELRGETRSPAFTAVLERAAAETEEQPLLGVVQGSGAASPRRVLRPVAVAATVAGLLLVDGGSMTGPTEDEEFAALVAAYSNLSAGASPTSSLLEVPGMELVRGVPSLGIPSLGLDPSGVVR
jgi:hypothetical protein